MNTAFQQQNKNGFLNVQAILRLIEDDGTRRIDDLGRDLVAAMRRQTVHKHRMFGGVREQLLIHLKRREDLARSAASSSCPMLAHTSV